MPPHRRAPALAILAASVGAAASAQAQTLALGSPVSAAGSFVGRDSLDGAGLYTQTALTAAGGRAGVTVQAVGARIRVADGGHALEARGAGVAVSAFYGVTDAVTVGAGVPYSSVTTEISAGPLGAESTEDGLGDAELFARVAAFRSASGTTRLALGGGLTLATGDEALTADAGTYHLGAALTHRVRRLSLHLAPAARFIPDADASYDVNVAAAVAATPRVTVAVEALTAFDGASSGSGGGHTRLADLAGGLRYRALGNLALDLGLRTNVSNDVDGVELTRGGLSFGASWLF
jgi:hypothetical protein